MKMRKSANNKMNLNKFEQINFITRLTKNKEAKNIVKFVKKVFLGENIL